MKESHKIQPFLQLNGKKFLHQFICYQCSINLQISIPNFLNIYIVYSSYRKWFQMKSVDFPQLLHVYFNYSHCVAMVDKLSTKVLLLSYRPQPEFKHIVLACHKLSLVWLLCPEQLWSLAPSSCANDSTFLQKVDRFWGRCWFKKVRDILRTKDSY